MCRSGYLGTPGDPSCPRECAQSRWEKARGNRRKQPCLLLLAFGDKGLGIALMWGSEGTAAVLEPRTWQECTGGSRRVTGEN